MANIFEGRRFNTLVSPQSDTDYKIHSYLSRAAMYPKNYRVPGLLDIVYDQGSTSKCVVYTFKEIVDYFNYKEYGEQILTSVNFMFSNRYPTQAIYRLMGFEGLYMSEAIANLKNDGVCEDTLWRTLQPDTETEWNDADITAEMRTNAKRFVVRTYFRLNTIDDIKTALMNLGPIAISIPISDKFTGGYNDRIDKEYALDSQHFQGNHCIFGAGWHEYNGVEYIDCLNTWGREFGESGWFYIPSSSFFNEAWSLTDKLIPHWSDPYYKYLTSAKSVVFDEKGYDLPATRGYVFKYFARGYGYKGEDTNDGYWNFLNTKNKINLKNYDNNITRGELFAMLAKMVGIKEPPVYQKGVPWPEVYWKYLNQHGIVVNEKNYPDNVTRAETITLLARLLGCKEMV